MKILHVYMSLQPEMGGPVAVAISLCRELSKIDCDVTLLTCNCGNMEDLDDVGLTKIVIHRITLLETFSSLCRSFLFLSLVESADIIHLHGIWPVVNWIVGKQALKKKKKIIISPHASFLDGDLNKSLVKQLKKWISWQVFVKKLLQNSKIQATSLNELKSLQNIGIQADIAVIPNGISIIEYSRLPSKSVFSECFPEIADKKILLFLSRITPNKGIKLLANAWCKIAKRFSNWHLLIVGPDHKNYWSHVRDFLLANNMNEHFTYAGQLTGERKLAVYNAASLFVLPTLWENFGIVIAEALMSKTPVITTTGTPWIEIVDKRCGWIIQPNEKQLIDTLINAMTLDEIELHNMGERGYDFVKEMYNWEKIACLTKDFYTWIHSGCKKPPFIYHVRGKNRIKLPFRKPEKWI